MEYSDVAKTLPNAVFSFQKPSIYAGFRRFCYHVTPLLNVLMVQNDILVEPPYGTLYGVTSGSKLGFVKASGYEKSLVTTAFL